MHLLPGEQTLSLHTYSGGQAPAPFTLSGTFCPVFCSPWYPHMTVLWCVQMLLLFLILLTPLPVVGALQAC